MKLTTRIILVSVIAVLAIFVSAFVSHTNTAKINETRNWVEHTRIVIGRLDCLYGLIKEAETGVRGFLFTHQAKMQADYEESKSEANTVFEDLKQLISDNPSQVERLAGLKTLFEERVNEWRQLMEASGPVGSPSWQKSMQQSFESRYAGKLKMLIDEMKVEEQSLLKTRTQTSLQSVDNSQRANIAVTGFLVLLLCAISTMVVLYINKAIAALLAGTRIIGEGNYKHRINLRSNDELGTLSSAFDSMTSRVEAFDKEKNDKNWIKRNINEFGLMLQGQHDYSQAGEALLGRLAPLVEARQAVLYRVDKQVKPGRLLFAAGFACDTESGIPESIRFGDGAVGQCAADGTMVHLEGVDADSFKIKSALSDANAADVYILPIQFEGETRGVIELAGSTKFSATKLAFIEQLCDLLGVVFNSIEATQVTERLLEEARQLNEDLQLQQEELEAQAEELEMQQEELRRVNDDMQVKTEALEEQNAIIFEKNIELEGMRQSLEDKAYQLAASSKYKSEFLANMSHDLRTPLNSLLIFSELLADNEEGNLNDAQIDFAKNINLAGKTLLALIDDILDLSKIEAGRVTPDIKNVEIAGVLVDIERSFRKVAEGKKLQFSLQLKEGTPRLMRTDERRLLQLLNNLLSNAFKFTDKGSVEVTVSSSKDDPGNGNQGQSGMITFAVSDTGIGIDKGQLSLIFEAFHQADSSSTRKFGGTGLGLSICRELSALLGGWVDVTSEVGKGSTFTLHLPVEYKGNVAAGRRVDSTNELRPSSQVIREGKDEDAFLHADVSDDRLNINEGDRVILIIEDDLSFATMLLDLARKNKYKGVVSSRGGDGLVLARRILPDAITLDLKLPDMEGWVVLDQLKNNPATRHIPVHIISAAADVHRGLSLGAIGYLEKPVTLDTLKEAIEKINACLQKSNGSVLLAESDQELRCRLVELLDNGDINIESVALGEGAMKSWAERSFDCSIINISLTDMDGLTLAKKFLTSDYTHPLLVFSNHGLSENEKAELEALSRTSIVKGIDTKERLLSEVGLFLHRVETKLPLEKQQLVTKIRQEDNSLFGRKLLIVDDDPRNIQALSSLLKKFKMNLIAAENGREALEKLNENKDVDAILMDVMMPEMDGYDAMRAIRAQREFRTLPIIAVTAKAMQGDRQKCIDSGASDYITKPVDRNQLLSLLRVWLYKA